MCREEEAMRIAVISEVSARDKNKFILDALKQVNTEVYNIGMSESVDKPELTYIHTGLMAGLSLATGAADFVVGGCGTGQGFLISAMQYPGVFCGHITNPLDAWLFSQINGGNCVSLALNKGFGWAGDIELKYIFEKLFSDEPGQGYPPARSESQRESRGILKEINMAAHKDFVTILRSIDKIILNTAVNFPAFKVFCEKYANKGDIFDIIINN
jgi:ribose 5-phosphate isomerase RpiB